MVLVAPDPMRIHALYLSVLYYNNDAWVMATHTNFAPSFCHSGGYIIHILFLSGA